MMCLRRTILLAMLAYLFPLVALAQVPQGVPQGVPQTPGGRPTQPQLDVVSNALRAKDVPAQDAAVAQIKTWLKADQLPIEVWSTWMPALRTAVRHQDIADLSLACMTGSVRQPLTDAISTVVDFRVQALIALKKYPEALEASKIYFNVCDITKNAQAVTNVANVLVKLHPTDPEIVRKFRAAQTAGEPGILKDVTIDDKPFKDAISKFESKQPFAQKACYGNLLLMADKGEDAEKLFRELYQLAANEAELKLATEGIARSLRAQDSNPARANTWLATLKKTATTATSQPK